MGHRHAHAFTRRKKSLNSEMNVVPYIDVMLVLLVIFIVTAPMIHTGVEVSLPKEETKTLEPSKKLPVIVSMKADGSLFVSHKNALDEPVDEDRLRALMQRLLDEDSQLQVMLNADAQSAYADIMHLMAVIQATGVQEVGLLSDSKQ